MKKFITIAALAAFAVLGWGAAAFEFAEHRQAERDVHLADCEIHGFNATDDDGFNGADYLREVCGDLYNDTAVAKAEAENAVRVKSCKAMKPVEQAAFDCPQTRPSVGDGKSDVGSGTDNPLAGDGKSDAEIRKRLSKLPDPGDGKSSKFDPLAGDGR